MNDLTNQFQSHIVMAEKPYNVFVYKNKEFLKLGVEVATLLTVMPSDNGDVKVKSKSVLREITDNCFAWDGTSAFVIDSRDENFDFVCRQDKGDTFVFFRENGRFLYASYELQNDWTPFIIENIFIDASINVDFSKLPEEIEIYLFIQGDGYLIGSSDYHTMILVKQEKIENYPLWKSLASQLNEWYKFYESKGKHLTFHFKCQTDSISILVKKALKYREITNNVGKDKKLLLDGTIDFINECGLPFQINQNFLTKLFVPKKWIFNCWYDGKEEQKKEVYKKIEDAIKLGWLTRNADGIISLSDDLAILVDNQSK